MTQELRLEAYMTTEYSQGGPGRPASYAFHLEAANVEEARELAARFPKSCGMKAGTLWTAEGARGWVSCQATLQADGVNRGVNETGLRRYRAVLAAAERLGLTVAYVPQAGHAYASRADFEAAVAAVL